MLNDFCFHKFKLRFPICRTLNVVGCIWSWTSYQQFLGKQTAAAGVQRFHFTSSRRVCSILPNNKYVMMFLRLLYANKRVAETSTDGQIFGFSLDAQTEDITMPEIKEELKRLKSALANFRNRMIITLVNQNLIADIPSFPEQLRDSWNMHTAAAEIAEDVRAHFETMPAIFQEAFERLRRDHRAAFEIVLEQKANEIEGGLKGTDSTEEMRRARMKLRQRVLDLEVDNSQMHETLKQMSDLLERRRADFGNQLEKKQHETSKYREDGKRIRDLAWTLAETLARLRDEAVASMPERKSLVDMMALLHTAEKRLGKHLRKPGPRRKSTPQLQVEGVRQATILEYENGTGTGYSPVNAVSSTLTADSYVSSDLVIKGENFGGRERYCLILAPAALRSKCTLSVWVAIQQRIVNLWLSPFLFLNTFQAESVYSALTRCFMRSLYLHTFDSATKRKQPPKMAPKL